MAVAEADLNQFRDRVVGRRVAESTFNQYATWVQRFEAWKGDASPALGTLIDFDSYLADADRPEYEWENGQGRPAPDAYSYSSRTLALSAIKLWLRLQYDEEIHEEVQNIVSGEPDDFDPKYLSRDDVRGVIASAGDDCPLDGCEAALEVTYDAILRGKELTRIERGDIDFDNGTLYVRAAKGSNNMELGLCDSALDALKAHVDQYPDREYPFWNTYGRKWKPGAWTTHFWRHHHEVGAHSFGRHSPILHRLQEPEAFHDMGEEKDAFGQVYQRARHSNPSMTSRYARIAGAAVPDWAEG
jgi:integrase